MKTILGILILICVLGLTAGCHSGIIRGAGSDVSRMGNSMQK